MPFKSVKADIDVRGQPQPPVAVQIGGRNGGENPVNRLIAQGEQARHVGVHLRHAQLRGLRKSDNARHVFRRGTQTEFMAAAVLPRKNLHAAANVQCADAFGPVNFMPVDRRQIHPQLLRVERNFSERLAGVRVKINAAFPAQFPDLFERLNHADFIVGVHDRHQNRLRPQVFLQAVDINKAVRADRQVRHGKALRFKPFAGIQDAIMLNRGDHEMIPVLPVRKRHAFQRKIVRFRAAGREYNFLAAGVQRGRKVSPRLLNGVAGFLTFDVQAGRIAVFLAKIRQHGRQHALIHLRAGSVIKIDNIHCVYLRILVVIVDIRRGNALPEARRPAESRLASLRGRAGANRFASAA